MRALLLGLALVAVPASASGFGPFATPSAPVTREVPHPASARTDGEGGLFLKLSYDFYQRVVSPTNGPQCNHRPSCSRYALLAVERYGAVGLLLTTDRLIRGTDSSELRKLRFFIVGDNLYYLDPLEESTFWFTSSR